MRFSILIPTRNRLEFLRYAVETVRRQSYTDWEIVIADNASDEPVAEYVTSLAERRIIYTRTDALIPVTENWNRALELSTGDYVIMLGDDDGLLQGCMETLRALAERFERPDAVYLNTYLFAYPGAAAEYPDGYLQPYGYALFFRGATGPFVLPSDQAVRLARDAVHFHARYGFNMQFVATSRAMIDRMLARGPFYQSTFPDYFAMNAIFLTAEKIVVAPQPLVVIGISPKSYGHYYAAGNAAAGNDFLASFPTEVSPELRNVVLPGDSINNGWLYAMDVLHRVYGRELGTGVDYARYRQVQLLAAARDDAAHKMTAGQLRELRSLLTPRERLFFAAARASARLTHARLLAPLRKAAARVWRAVGPRLRGGNAQFVPWNPPRIAGRYRNVVEVFEGLAE
jgi:glycosyltransferase involved in cell wall biosynthesis